MHELGCKTGVASGASDGQAVVPKGARGPKLFRVVGTAVRYGVLWSAVGLLALASAMALDSRRVDIATAFAYGTVPVTATMCLASVYAIVNWRRAAPPSPPPDAVIERRSVTQLRGITLPLAICVLVVVGVFSIPALALAAGVCAGIGISSFLGAAAQLWRERRFGVQIVAVPHGVHFGAPRRDIDRSPHRHRERP